MKSFSIAFVLAMATAAVSAQTPMLDLTNHNWLIISGTKHTTTLQSYAWYLNNPNTPTTGYFSPALVGGGATPVIAGTHSWRIIPRELDNRQEPRQFKGARHALSTAAATTAPPAAGYYYPEIEIRKTVPRAGGGFNPDWSASGALAKIAQGTVTTITAYGHYSVTGTLAVPIAYTANDYCMTTKWVGGESDDISGSQGVFGDYSAGVYTLYPTDYGVSDPANVNYPTSYDFSVPWFQPFEDKTVIAGKADWATRRYVISPSMYGTDSHRLQSDNSTTAANFGWDIDGGTSRSGFVAIFLMNIGLTVYTGSFNLLGIVTELNIFDPALGTLSNVGYAGMLDPTGKFAAPFLPVPALGSVWVGQYITVEGFVIDPANPAVVADSTGTTSFKY